jgi:hypothetical protein
MPVPSGVLTILPGKGPETGTWIAREPIGAKSRYYGIFFHPGYSKCDEFTIYKAGTSTGRAIGSIVGANLASYTAELGGKVGPHFIYVVRTLTNNQGTHHCLRGCRPDKCRQWRCVCCLRCFWPNMRFWHTPPCAGRCIPGIYFPFLREGRKH